MKGFNLEKFIIDLNNSFNCTSADFITNKIKEALNNQNLEIKGDRIVEKECPFKVGDWVVAKCNGKFCSGKYHAQITDICSEGLIFDYNSFGVDPNMYRKWTIKDAKPGDVLIDVHAGVYYVALFKNYNEEKNTFSIYCARNFGGDFVFGLNNIDPEGMTPATEKQRKAFLKFIENQNFIWDEDKLELYRKTLVAK